MQHYLAVPKDGREHTTQACHKRLTEDVTGVTQLQSHAGSDHGQRGFVVRTLKVEALFSWAPTSRAESGPDRRGQRRYHGSYADFQREPQWFLPGRLAERPSRLEGPCK